MGIKIIENDQKFGIVTLSGELDGVSTPQVSNEIAQLIEQGIDRIVLDFSEIRFISSVGIGMIVNYEKKLKKNKGSISIICQTPRLIVEFQKIHLDKVIQIFQNLDEAIAVLKKSPL